MSGKMKGEPAYVEEVDEQTGKTIKRSAKKEQTKQEIPGHQRRRPSRRDNEDPKSDSRCAKPNSSSRLRSPVKRVEFKQTSREERPTNGGTTSPKRSSLRPQNSHGHINSAQPLEPPIRGAPGYLIQYPQFHAVAQYPAAHYHAAQYPASPSNYHDGMPYGVYGPPPSNSPYFLPHVPALAYPPPTAVCGFSDPYSNGPIYHQNSLSAMPPSPRQDFFVPPPQAPRRTLEERLGGTGRRKSLAWTNTGCDDRGYDVGEPERSDHQRPRRNSYYAPHTPSPRPPPANYQDKLNSAERYQRSVGGPTVEVTAESLKESDRRARSHITRSRASRDGSENLRSSVTSRTTRTTGTGASEENVTIKLKGEGTIKIAGAEIEYKDDTELHIQRGFNVDSGVG